MFSNGEVDHRPHRLTIPTLLMMKACHDRTGNPEIGKHLIFQLQLNHRAQTIYHVTHV